MSTPTVEPAALDRRPAGPDSPQWTIEVHRSDAALDGIGAEWDDLLSRCATGTPFQSHGWLSAWWRHYGRPGRLVLVLVRRGAELVGAAALYRDRHWYGTVLRPVGGALSDFVDVLVDDRHTAAATRILLGALVGQPGWQVLDLPEVRPGATADGPVRAEWPGRQWDLPASLCLERPVSTVEELVRDLPSHARKTVRRRLNQLDKSGLTTRSVPLAEVDRAVRDLLALHRRQWQGRGVNPEHLRPAFAGLLADALPAMVHSGQATLLEYRLDDRVVAINLVVVGPALAGGYLYGAEPELRDRLDISTLLVTSTLTEAYQRGCGAMSMLRGAEPYKARWRPVEVLNTRRLLARPGRPRALAYVAAVRSRASLVRWAKRRAPWLRQVRDTVVGYAGRWRGSS